MAEGGGFEPPDGVAVYGFQDRRLRPLGHPSVTHNSVHIGFTTCLEIRGNT